MRTILCILLGLTACDLTTHGDRGAPPLAADTLGPCCYQSACVQPRIEQDYCDPGLTECTGTAVGLGGPLWECRETSPVTANVSPNGGA